MQPSGKAAALEARLAAAREQQAATSEILRLMATSPGDVQPVLDAVALWAARLCKSPFARVIVREGDGLRIVAHHSAAGEPPIPILPIALNRMTVTGRAVLDRETVHHADMVPLLRTKYPASRGNIELIGARAVLAVPLLHEGNIPGAIFLWRREPGLFAPDQVALVQTFARQAAIAMENVRLFNAVADRNRDLTEALEHEAATGEILQIISRSPTDVQPVFDTIAHSAARLCDAEFCHLFRFDGELIHFAAHHGLAPESLATVKKAYPMAPGRGSAAARAILTRSIAHIPNVHEDTEYAHGDHARVMAFESIVAVPMLRDGAPIGAIAVARPQSGAFPERQLALLHTFADQAVIAIENVRLFNELEVRNRDLTELLEQQTATSDILRVISSSPTDLQPVFDAIARDARRLCDATYSVIGRYDGELLHLVAHEHVRPEGIEAMRRLFPMRPSHATTSSRAILERAVVHLPDVLQDPDYATPVALGIQNRSTLAAPMLRHGEPIGTISVGRLEQKPFTDKQIALLKTFAEQAVIAIENVRLFTELGNRNRELVEALEQQNATSEVLNVINRSPTDVHPVFDTIAQSALTLCRASAATMLTYDGELIHLESAANVKPEATEAIRKLFPRPPSNDTAGTRAILTRRVVMIPDVLEDPDYSIGSASHFTGFRAVMAVPLIRDEAPIGAIAVGRPEAGPFSEKQIALLQTFADQAVIAIENVRLFTELEARNNDLTEALEQQTATSEILRVISQSQTDVQPVFDTIAAATHKLCGASSANVFTFDGELVHLVSFVNVNPEYGEKLRAFFPRRPSRDIAATRAVMSCKVESIPDILEDHDYALVSQSLSGGFRSVLAVPLVREQRPIGVIAVGRPEPGTFPDNQIALLQTFADQAVIAIENVRLLNELKARTTELTQSVGELKALGEVGQAVSSTLDLDTVLRTIVARATELAGADGGAIYEYDEARKEFHLRTAERYADELIELLRAKPIRKGEGALGRLAVQAEPVQIRDIAHDRTYRTRVREVLLRLGYRSALAIPLVREDHLLGGLVVNRAVTGEFAPQLIELLKTFATQSALAIQNARLFREIGDKSRQLEVASRHKSEFLANMSHELRTPLNAIIGFSEVLADRMFGEINDKQAEYLADILESGRHLLHLINDILDLAKIEAGRMELEPSDFSLPGAIDNTMALVRERAQRREIRLSRAIDPGVGNIRADERKVKQVLLNLLSNAIKFTPEGGKIDVVAALRDGTTQVSVTDTGVGIAAEDLDAVFEEFRQVGPSVKMVEGTGLGLAISRKFIELHGGRIWVTSTPGVGSTFAFTLPNPTEN
jgi:GAF domain-containing protein